MTKTIQGQDGKMRCKWCASDETYIDYHDNEWGMPSSDDFKLFEKLCLEGFQSGLSWRTILGKRENFRAAFANFDFTKIAQFDEKDFERLVNDAGIVRHRGKIEATINNAKRAIEMVEKHGSIAKFLWQFEPKDGEVETAQSASTCPSSVDLSKELKKLGWKFVGPTTIFAFMQANGFLNDHVEDCFAWEITKKARDNFARP